MKLELGNKKIKSVNSLILHLSEQRPVAYNQKLGKLAKSAIAGLFMSQILYWADKGYDKNGYIYKTIKELAKETYLTRSEQDRAIRIWKKLGVLDVKLRGIPPKRHFKVNVDKLLELLGFSDGWRAYANNQICQFEHIKKRDQPKYIT